MVSLFEASYIKYDTKRRLLGAVMTFLKSVSAKNCKQPTYTKSVIIGKIIAIFSLHFLIHQIAGATYEIN